RRAGGDGRLRGAAPERFSRGCPRVDRSPGGGAATTGGRGRGPRDAPAHAPHRARLARGERRAGGSPLGDVAAARLARLPVAAADGAGRGRALPPGGGGI